MSHALQTKKLFERNSYDDELPKANPLLHEFGWTEVAAGLSRVLLGYLMTFASAVLIAILVFVAVVMVGKQLMAGDMKRFDIRMLWFLLGGMGVVTVMSFVSYIMILTGKIRCAVHTPDRGGARWLIFLCILCLVVGPVMDIVSSFIPADQARLMEIQQKMEEDEDFAMEEHLEEILFGVFRARTIMTIFGAVVGLLASVFFVLFFRAIGICFQETRLISAVEFYLIYSFVLIGASAFMVWSMFSGNFQPIFILGVLGGWLINLIWYVFLVFFTRCVILSYCNDLRKSTPEAS